MKEIYLGRTWFLLSQIFYRLWLISVTCHFNWEVYGCIKQWHDFILASKMKGWSRDSFFQRKMISCNSDGHTGKIIWQEKKWMNFKCTLRIIELIDFKISKIFCELWWSYHRDKSLNIATLAFLVNIRRNTKTN